MPCSCLHTARSMNQWLIVPCLCCHAAAVVFDMHYNELLMKNEEIERLKTVIEGLGGGS